MGQFWGSLNNKFIVQKGKNGPRWMKIGTKPAIFWTPKTPFFVQRIKKHIYTKCRPYMGLHSCQLPGLLKKKIIGSDKTKHVKKFG